MRNPKRRSFSIPSNMRDSPFLYLTNGVRDGWYEGRSGLIFYQRCVFSELPTRLSRSNKHNGLATHGWIVGIADLSPRGPETVWWEGWKRDRRNATETERYPTLTVAIH